MLVGSDGTRAATLSDNATEPNLATAVAALK
jgi:hypothetical protein